MNNSRNTFLLPLLLLSCTALGVMIGRMVTVAPGPEAGDPKSNYAKLQNIIDVLDKNYVDSIKHEALFEETITDMLHRLDPHSNYIPAAQMQQANEQIRGEFGGVGIRFAMIRDSLCVTNIIPGSPSERAGLKAGDRIILIGRKNIAGKKVNTDDIMGLLKGEPGKEVDITLLRGKKKMGKRLVRDIIPIASISCATMLDNQTGYIRLSQFSTNSAQEFHEAAQQLLDKGMKKLIFDLRENGGGVLGGAVQIADEFLKNKLGIVEIRGAHKPTETHKATADGILEATELVVLINSGSASASEILAGAIQDNDRGTIIGRRSFGKGLVQQDFELRDGSNLRLTIARYYVPSGRCIQKEFADSYEDYYKDQLEREESGELFHPDSSAFNTSKKFYTVFKHRTVYGGGGVMPDVFVPLDTSLSTGYYVHLRYSPAIQQFAFDYVQNRRNQWKTAEQFVKSFEADAKLVNELAAYADRYHRVTRNEEELKKSEILIRQALKAEIANQLFTEQGYFMVVTRFDPEIRRALQYLRTKK